MRKLPTMTSFSLVEPTLSFLTCFHRFMAQPLPSAIFGALFAAIYNALYQDQHQVSCIQIQAHASKDSETIRAAVEEALNNLRDELSEGSLSLPANVTRCITLASGSKWVLEIGADIQGKNSWQEDFGD